MSKNKNQVGKYLPHKSYSQSEAPQKNYILSAVIGLAIFILCNCLLSLLGAAIIKNSPNPTVLIPFISTISMTVSAIVGSIIASKKSGGNAVLSSIIFLLGITLLVLIMTVIYMGETSANHSFWQALLLKIPVILGGFFGGYIGSIKKKPKSLYEKYK